MTIIVITVQITLIAIVGFYLLYLLMLTAAAPLGKKRPKSFDTVTVRRFAIVVPAHNEELIIERTLKSLLAIEYPRDHFDVVVVADNCTDQTEQIARRSGAIVHARSDAALRGKGYALRWCFDRLLADQTSYDAFVVIDADTVVSGNMLSIMNFYLDRGSRVVQCADLAAAQRGSWSSEMTRIGFLLYNFIRPLGRKALHLPIGLRGNGMCFSKAILESNPWESFSLNEDLEYGLQLLLKGIGCDFAPEAEVLATMPTDPKNARSQRIRWEGGRFPVIRKYAPRLLAKAVQMFSYKYFDTFVELVTPTLVNLLAVSILMTFFSLLLGLFGVGDMFLFGLLWLIVGSLGFIHMFAGLFIAGADAETYKTIIHLPRYALWKVGVYVRHMVPGLSGGWVRTTREGSQPPV